MTRTTRDILGKCLLDGSGGFKILVGEEVKSMVCQVCQWCPQEEMRNFRFIDYVILDRVDRVEKN